MAARNEKTMSFTQHLLNGHVNNISSLVGTCPIDAIKNIQNNRRIEWNDFKTWMITPIIKHSSTSNYVLLKQPLVIRRAITCIINSTDVPSRGNLLEEMLNHHTYTHCLVHLIRAKENELINLLNIPTKYATLKVTAELNKCTHQETLDVCKKLYPRA